MEAFWSFTASRPGQSIILPDGRCDVIVRYHGAQSGAPVLIVTGPAMSAYTVTYSAGDRWFGIRLRPDHGVSLWKAAIGRACDAVLRGDEAKSLLPELASLEARHPSPPEFRQACQAWLNYGSVRRCDYRLNRALELLQASGGLVKVQDLALRAGCTTRHLNRIFRSHIGLPVKTYAQIVQFHRALRLIQIEGRSITSAAVLGGYSDQAHMTRSFQRFGGFAPSRAPEGLLLPTLLS